ncbi:hypothetical protein FQN49_000741 [Arthroderma sp. PD_2]|nr:hypothetical protein FQN49_000741 [Arthroderma sp. PD_2]
MAPVARSFSRLALSCSRQAIPRRTSSRYTQVSCSTINRQRQQPFSAASMRLAEGYDLGDDPALERELMQEVESSIRELKRNAPTNYPALQRQRKGFWAEEEEDEFMTVTEDNDEEFYHDDITSMAHAELEEHRELREYARITAWDMPSLSGKLSYFPILCVNVFESDTDRFFDLALAKPFTLPPQTHILRFRQTTYLGETHPAETKVVLELCSKDLAPTYLTEEQRITLLKLVGPRYNPDSDIIHMSCEKFPTRAQNKRYLGDLVGTLIKEAKEGDSFADIPLTFHHHKPKKRYVFPESWKVTEESKKQIESARQQIDSLITDKGIVDGNEVIAQAAKTLPGLNSMDVFGSSEQKVPAKKGQKARGPKARH